MQSIRRSAGPSGWLLDRSGPLTVPRVAGKQQRLSTGAGEQGRGEAAKGGGVENWQRVGGRRDRGRAAPRDGCLFVSSESQSIDGRYYIFWCLATIWAI